MSSSSKLWATFSENDLLLRTSDPEKEYYRRKEEEKNAIHWGQKKLLLSLVQFLTLYWNPSEYPNPILLYIGAAPGTNIEYVMKNLFPSFTSYLYDPSKMPVTPAEKFQVIQDFFTTETAKEWSGKKGVFLVSDIRSVSYTGISKNEYETKVWGDMKLQEQWIQIIRPVKAQLKFRLPYYYPDIPDYTFASGKVEYLNGTVYKGIYAPQTSTETRLVTSADQETVWWDIKKYESQLFYFNDTIRSNVQYLNPFFSQLPESKGPIDLPELLNDYDSLAEIWTWMLFLKKFGGISSITLDNVIGLSRRSTAALNRGSNISQWMTIDRLRSDPSSLREIKKAKFLEPKEEIEEQSPVRSEFSNRIKKSLIIYIQTEPRATMKDEVNQKIVDSLNNVLFGPNRINLGETEIVSIIQSESWDEADLIWRHQIKGISDQTLKNLGTNPIGLINHFEGSLNFSSKGTLALLSQKMNFLPPSTTHDSFKDPKTTLNEIKSWKFPNVYGSDWYIVKPLGGSQGVGIKIFSSVKDVENWVRNFQSKSIWVIQKYLEYPLLYSKRKFDIRVYILVLPEFSNPKKLRHFLFNGGFLRLTSEEYKLKPNDINLYTHLTNVSVQEKLSSLNEIVLDIWKTERLFSDIEGNNMVFNPSTHLFNPLIEAWKEIFRLDPVRFPFINLNFNQNPAEFQLFGLDVILDEQMNPKILEINTNPVINYDLTPDNPFVDISQMINKTFQLIFRNRLGLSLELESSIATPARNDFREIII